MTCHEIQLRMTEFVMDVLPAEQWDEIFWHLRKGECINCLKHEEAERILRAVGKRKNIEDN